MHDVALKGKHQREKQQLQRRRRGSNWGDRVRLCLKTFHFSIWLGGFPLRRPFKQPTSFFFVLHSFANDILCI